KLSAATKAADSPYEMARALYSGGSMHGDIALVEAVCSLEAFYHLLAIGVPFPRNRYGGVVGYKTDHDPKDRGTSIGPYTSKSMVEQLLREVRRRGIRIYDKYEIVSLLVEEGRAAGALCMNTKELDNGQYGLELFMADVTVFGVGGPGGIYEASVYPPVHTGAIGLALEAGAEAVNLTESQYGLASVKFRWNVSGTYQQVIPRYISTDASGGDEKEFLAPFFQDAGKMNCAVFLKGYQWPFDPRKIENGGSSLIDILVYRERVLLGRRVFLDYRRNPGIEESFRFEDLSEEAFTYLKNSAALFGTPLERLGKMNAPAIELYRSRGIDLSREPLEIAVSAQHNNGGLAADIFWESTNIRRLFPVGEVNGTHGVYRPGGSALNSGQVGALRAAQKIAESYANDSVEQNVFEAAAQRETQKILGLIAEILDTDAGNDTAAGDYRRNFQRRMTAAGSHIRSAGEAAKALKEALAQAAGFSQTKIKSLRQLPFALKNRHLVLAHTAYLSAITASLAAGGGSRGSYLVMDAAGKPLHPALEEAWRYKPEAEELREKLLVTRLARKENRAAGEDPFDHNFIPRRPIPDEDFWFEEVWRENREKTYFR
ncbi:MAG: FAD-binding protein, partial [Spirochaetaceae bacterium]|nr:FAD-binding protein [Spirochaetaceae bacterium]